MSCPSSTVTFLIMLISHSIRLPFFCSITRRALFSPAAGGLVAGTPLVERDGARRREGGFLAVSGVTGFVLLSSVDGLSIVRVGVSVLIGGVVGVSTGGSLSAVLFEAVSVLFVS